jgi:predicted membrane protein
LYGFTPYDADCVTLLGASLAAALYAYAGYYVYTDQGKQKKKRKKLKEKYEVDRRAHTAQRLYTHTT